jgi:hypothetical protein
MKWHTTVLPALKKRQPTILAKETGFSRRAIIEWQAGQRFRDDLGNSLDDLNGQERLRYAAMTPQVIRDRPVERRNKNNVGESTMKLSSGFRSRRELPCALLPPCRDSPSNRRRKKQETPCHKKSGGCNDSTHTLRMEDHAERRVGEHLVNCVVHRNLPHHPRFFRRDLQPFCQIQDPRPQNFWEQFRIEGTNFRLRGGQRPRHRPGFRFPARVRPSTFRLLVICGQHSGFSLSLSTPSRHRRSWIFAKPAPCW